MVKKGKKKDWYTIIVSKPFNKEITKAMAEEPEKLIGRKISVSLLELTNDFSKYYMKFIFKIKKVENGNAIAEFNGSECLQDYISRMIVRRVRRIDVIQDLETRDKVKIRVKSLVVVSKRVKSTMEKVIRKKVEEMMKDFVGNLTLEDFIQKIISDEIKNKMIKDVSKIYPVRYFEIRKTEVLS